jgi:hypothetical protein
MERIINIRDDLAKKIATIANERQIKVEALVNEILERYLVTQSVVNTQSGPEFLLSIAGCFDSGTQDTSDQVQEIVADFILRKHQVATDDGTD